MKPSFGRESKFEQSALAPTRSCICSTRDVGPASIEVPVSTATWHPPSHIPEGLLFRAMSSMPTCQYDSIFTLDHTISEPTSSGRKPPKVISLSPSSERYTENIP